MPGLSLANGGHCEFYLMNFSGAFSLMAADAVEDAINQGWDSGPALVGARRAILFGLPGDNSFYCRVVLNRPLDEDENAEWIAKATGALSIKDGGLVVCAGYDMDLLADWKDAPDEEGDAIHHMGVPPGDYTVEIYTHRPAMAGRYLEKTWPTRLGPWFRQSYPGAKLPPWIAREFLYTKGAMEEYEVVKKAAAEGKAPLDTSYKGATGYLIRIASGAPSGELTKIPEHGFIEYSEGARVPTRCPRGIYTSIDDNSVKSFAEGIAE